MHEEVVLMYEASSTGCVELVFLLLCYWCSVLDVAAVACGSGGDGGDGVVLLSC